MLESRYREAIERAREALEAPARSAPSSPRSARSTRSACRWPGPATRRASRTCARRSTLAREHDMLAHRATRSTPTSPTCCCGAARRRGARRRPTSGVEPSPPSAGHFSRWMSLMKAEIAFALGDWADGRRAAARARPPAQPQPARQRGPPARRAGARPRRPRPRRRAARRGRAAASPTSREPQFIGPQAAMRAELAAPRRRPRRGPRRRRRRPRPHRVLLGGLAPASRMVSLAGLARRGRRRRPRPRPRGGRRAADPPRRDAARCGSRRPPARAGPSRPPTWPRARALSARATGAGRPGAVGRRRASAWARAERPYDAAEARWREAEARLAAGDREGAAAIAARRRWRPRARSAPPGWPRRSRASSPAPGSPPPRTLRTGGRRPVRPHAARAAGARAAGRRAPPTARSARRSTWPRRPPPSTSRASSPSSTCARAPRRRRSPTASVST